MRNHAYGTCRSDRSGRGVCRGLRARGTQHSQFGQCGRCSQRNPAGQRLAEHRTFCCIGERTFDCLHLQGWTSMDGTHELLTSCRSAAGVSAGVARPRSERLRMQSREHVLGVGMRHYGGRWIIGIVPAQFRAEPGVRASMLWLCSQDRLRYAVGRGNCANGFPQARGCGASTFTSSTSRRRPSPSQSPKPKTKTKPSRRQRR